MADVQRREVGTIYNLQTLGTFPVTIDGTDYQAEFIKYTAASVADIVYLEDDVVGAAPIAWRSGDPRNSGIIWISGADMNTAGYFSMNDADAGQTVYIVVLHSRPSGATQITP